MSRTKKVVSESTLKVMSKLARSGNYTANDVLSLIAEVRWLKKEIKRLQDK